MHQLAENYKDQ